MSNFGQKKVCVLNFVLSIEQSLVNKAERRANGP